MSTYYCASRGDKVSRGGCNCDVRRGAQECGEIAVEFFSPSRGMHSLYLHARSYARYSPGERCFMSAMTIASAASAADYSRSARRRAFLRRKIRRTRKRDRHVRRVFLFLFFFWKRSSSARGDCVARECLRREVCKRSRMYRIESESVFVAVFADSSRAGIDSPLFLGAEITG